MPTPRSHSVLIAEERSAPLFATLSRDRHVGHGQKNHVTKQTKFLESEMMRRQTTLLTHMHLTKNRTTPQNDPHHIKQTLTVEIMPTSMTTSRPQDCFANPTRTMRSAMRATSKHTRHCLENTHDKQKHTSQHGSHPFGRSVAQKNHNNEDCSLEDPSMDRQCVTCPLNNQIPRVTAF